MKYIDCVNSLTNINESRRIASAYVEDCRRLNIDEIKQSLIKTEEQFTSVKNISDKLSCIGLNPNPATRIISPIILREYLLNNDEFISTCKNTEDAVINYEQSVIDQSNNFEYKNISKDFSLFKFVIDKAWEHDGDISVDEKNLIESIREYLNITLEEQNMLEAKSGRFPKVGNVIHSHSEIEAVRKDLQAAGILFYIKNSDGESCDVIPEEIVIGIRKYYGIEIKKYGYGLLIEYVSKIGKKQYLLNIIEKYNQQKTKAVIDLPQNPTLTSIQSIIAKSVLPTNLIGGFTPRDGFDVTVLSQWCNNLSIPSSGTKAELIERIIKYYDGIQKIETSTDDEREKYYAVYSELANRKLQSLRKNGIIDKDLQCEHYFEEATDYLFEVKLGIKPLALVGTEHPDGKLSYRDKYVLWDNKSKETPVNLKDHIIQFDRYIKNSDKQVSVFLVIGPSFTDESVSECVKYALNSETVILLITADELKDLAQEWDTKHHGEIFNLGYFKQNGRFDKKMICF